MSCRFANVFAGVLATGMGLLAALALRDGASFSGPVGIVVGLLIACAETNVLRTGRPVIWTIGLLLWSIPASSVTVQMPIPVGPDYVVVLRPAVLFLAASVVALWSGDRLPRREISFSAAFYEIGVFVSVSLGAMVVLGYWGLGGSRYLEPEMLRLSLRHLALLLAAGWVCLRCPTPSRASGLFFGVTTILASVAVAAIRTLF